MNWFIISLIATFLWAISNIVDEFIVKKYSIGKRGSGGLVLFTSFMGVLMALLIGFSTHGLYSIPFTDKILLILTGGLTIGWIILYLYTLETEDVSSVVPWFLTIPIFGYILGYIFLGETLNIHQWTGSIIILIGIAIILIDFGEEKKKFKWEPFRNMIIACFMVAVSGVIFKYVTIEGNFWVSSFWEYVGIGILGLFIYFLVPRYRNQFHLMNKSGGYKIFLLNSISEITTIGGNLLTNFAMLLAPVTMVYLVGSFQPAIVLVLTLLSTHFTPHITKENLTKHILLPKIIAIIVMIIGSIFLLV